MSEVLVGKIAIIGVGMMGGSLGMALRQAGVAQKVVGCEPMLQRVEAAVRLGAVDHGTVNPAEAVAGAEVVFLATPLQAIVSTLKTLLPYLETGCLVSDLGSTKGQVVEQARALLPPEITFIGGHPMTGSERAGVEAADPYLFQNAVYVLVPPEGTPPPALALLTEIVRRIGGLPLTLTAAEHDQIVAAVSHLPHLIAVALVRTLGGLPQREQALMLAAGGFRDTTRVADGLPSLWREILASNRWVLLEVLGRFQKAIEELAACLERGEFARLETLLAEARALRAELPRRRKGLLTPLAELVVRIEDRPGALAEVTGVLARAQINIEDIEILRVREGEGGTLALGFETEEERTQALTLLREQGFQARPW